MKPVIAIVGRPNVGKSTLFNRIVGRRQAIVDDTAGVTRDRHYADADWLGHSFLMIDTGGIAEGDNKSIQGFIKKQTLTAVEEADIVICVFDGREGPTQLDRAIVELLRKSNKKVFYAVNKVEPRGITARDKIHELVGQFYELGISDNLFPVSAEHGIGVDDMLDAVIKTVQGSMFNVQGSEGEALELLRVAVIGRPNAGKSTLINRLFGKERVIAHETPGTTRDTIDVEIEVGGKKYTFVDTAGLKKKGKTIEALDKFSAIKSLAAIERANMALLVVDSNAGFTHQDASLLDYVYSAGRGVLVLFNKWDALNMDAAELREFYERKLAKMHYVPFLSISAKTGSGLEALFPEIDRVNAALHFKISTAVLNRMIEGLKDIHNIPMWKGKTVKFYYATQVGSSPPTFMIFSNYPEGVKASYKKYLINRLQEAIGCVVPVRLVFKKKQ